MRPAHSAFLLLALLLCNCQGPRSPKVRVVINRLHRGMLKGKTVVLEGMDITASQWPGKYIDAPILYEAEKALQPVLKDTRICLMPEVVSTHESPHAGNARETAAKSSSKEPDYIFRIMLRADSIFTSDNIGRDVDYMHVAPRTAGGYSSSGYASPGYRLGGYRLGSGGGFNYGSGYSWRKLTKRTLKADYILSDARTFKLIWRAEAVASDVHMSVSNSVIGYQAPPYRSAEELEAKVPVKPLWISMNAAAVRRIK